MRLFIIFIAIGIITSFSRIGNFLFLITIFFYLINEYFFQKKKDDSIKYIIIFIFLVDILIVGLYFGGSKIIDRFYFLSDELNEIYSDNTSLSRFEIAKFSFVQISNYLFFGYGAGSFETLFKINFIELNNFYANHAHSDLFEFFGEFGLVGSILLMTPILNFFLDKKSYSFINIILFIFLIIILVFDFSLHVPIIQILFLIFFTLNKKNFSRDYGSS